MKPSSLLPLLGITSLATAAIQGRQAEEPAPQATPTAIATTSPGPTAIPTQSTTAPVAQTTATYAQASDYGISEDSPGNAVDTDAGASGSGGGFTLSRGGLVAICIIVAIVVIFGIVTLTLFIIAKRRQWTMRQTLRRASRRLTGRGGGRQRQEIVDRRSKRAGLRMSAAPARQGHKRGLVVAVNDVEKGSGSQKHSGVLSRVGNTWTERLWRNDWKR